MLCGSVVLTALISLARSCDRFENLLTWHPNGTSFDIVLDGPTTKALISRLRPDSNPPQTAPATDTLLIPM